MLYPLPDPEISLLLPQVVVHGSEQYRLLQLFRSLLFPVHRARFLHHYHICHQTSLRLFNLKKDLSALDLVCRFWWYPFVDFLHMAYHPPYYPRQIRSFCTYHPEYFVVHPPKCSVLQ